MLKLKDYYKSRWSNCDKISNVVHNQGAKILFFIKAQSEYKLYTLKILFL